jgi:hypothetical protein
MLGKLFHVKELVPVFNLGTNQLSFTFQTDLPIGTVFVVRREKFFADWSREFTKLADTVGKANDLCRSEDLLACFTKPSGEGIPVHFSEYFTPVTHCYKILVVDQYGYIPIDIFQLALDKGHIYLHENTNP